MTYTLAGRTMLTFQGEDFSVTTLAAEGETDSRMGLHGIDGTLPEAIIAIEEIKRAYQAGNLIMSIDTEISMI